MRNWFQCIFAKNFRFVVPDHTSEKIPTCFAKDTTLKNIYIQKSLGNWHKLFIMSGFIMSHVYIIVECEYCVYIYIFLNFGIYFLELWLWPSPDVYISFLSVVRKHGISTFLAFKWRSAVKNPRQQETSVCIWMAEISWQSSCCSSKGNDFLDCEYDLSVCALLILIYTRRLKKYANK